MVLGILKNLRQSYYLVVFTRLVISKPKIFEVSIKFDIDNVSFLAEIKSVSYLLKTVMEEQGSAAMS